MTKFSCWQDQGHSVHFDSRVFYPTFCLKHLYGRFNEFDLLNGYTPSSEPYSLLDIGCATGEVSRYLRSIYPNMEYSGCDISENAIERGQTKYPGVNFLLVDALLSQISDRSFDYVFSRDVILHQEKPLNFLKKVCSIAKKGIFLRMRTRDVGETVFDIEKSCQLYNEQWAPYIIFNCDELIKHLTDLKIVSKIVILKDYMPLGGKFKRFVPKDCYLKKTKTSETAVYIEIGKGVDKPEVIIDDITEDFSVPLWCDVSKKAVRTVLSNFGKKVWW